MTNQHPITPPPDLVKELQDLGNLDAITLAYQAGADHQLKACCEVLDDVPGGCATSRHLFHVCRPKPPSLKEQALKMLRPLSSPVMLGTPEYRLYEPQAEIIRRALEALPND
jgi:hypothetical protein